MSDISAEWKELRSKIGNFTSHMNSTNAQIDARLKKLKEKEEQQADLQAKIDEAYNKGMQDLYDALHIFSEPVPVMREIFGSVYIEKIISEYSPKEIIDKVNQWKTEKDKEEQEFHIGDEIICISEYSLDYNKTFIYLGRTECYMKMFDLDKMRAEYTNNFVDYRKTGKHYDSIPLPKEIK